MALNRLHRHLAHKLMHVLLIFPLTYDHVSAHLRQPARSVTSTQLSQQQAAVVLGYTQVSWDNASGKEVQPASASKTWTGLTAQEKSAATVLRYTASTWSTISATKKTPWSDLTSTAGEDVFHIAFVLVTRMSCVVIRSGD